MNIVGERPERATVLGVDNANIIYVCIWYVCPLNARAGAGFPLKTWLFRLDPIFF